MVAKVAVMKRLVAILFGVLCCMGAANAVPATVNYIIDGDTFAAYVNIAPDVRISVRVRLINVDTPELHGKCEYEIARAELARARLGELIPVGTTVELTQIKDDKYLGRIDAYVAMPDGRDVGDVLMGEGLARQYAGGRRMSWCD